MTLNFAAKLKELTQKVKEKYYEEEVVEIDDDFYVVLGTLSSEEESQVHEYSSIWDKMAYLIRMKHDRLAISIKEINGLNLRGVDEINIGTEAKPETVSKREFLRDQIAEWDEVVVHFLNQQLNTATDRLQARVADTTLKKKAKEAETQQAELKPFEPTEDAQPQQAPA